MHPLDDAPFLFKALLMPTALIQDIIDIVEEMAPSAWAEKWDNTGLQIGSLRQTVNTVLLAVDPTTSVMNRAIEIGAELIITHHPLFFHPLCRLSLETPLGQIITQATKKNIAIYSAHTNLDIVPGGVSAALAKQLALKDLEVLRESDTAFFCKLAVFVPEDYEEQVREAMLTAGSGRTGGHRYYGFPSPRTGAGKNVDSAGYPEGKSKLPKKTAESKIELTLPYSEARSVLKKIRSMYPFLDMASDLYPLHNKPVAIGYGYIGKLSDKPVTFRQFVTRMKRVLRLPYLQMAGKAPNEVYKVAVCGGSGSELIENAYQSGADLYLTSELKHSHARLAEELQFCVLDIGHFHSEKFGMAALADFVRKTSADRGLKVSVIEDQTEIGPLQLIK